MFPSKINGELPAVNNSILLDCEAGEAADWGGWCECKAGEDGGCRFLTRLVDRDHLLSQFPWVVFVILAELFVRVIPSLLLVSLNAVMIHQFHAIIEKRDILRARTFVRGSAQLSIAAAGDNKEQHRVELNQDITTIKQKLKPRFCQNKNKTENSRYEKPKNTFFLVSKKDRSLIKLLFVMSVVFFVANIPMAFIRTVQAFNISSDTQVFKQFIIISNVAEIFFAASNFYLYCLCNNKFRTTVSANIFHCLPHCWTESFRLYL